MAFKASLPFSRAIANIGGGRLLRNHGTAFACGRGASSLWCWIHSIDFIQGKQDALKSFLVNGLSHEPQEVADVLHGHVGTQIQIRVAQELQDPLWELGALVVSSVTAVGENHQSIICLASNDTANTLRRLSDSVEIQKVLLSNLEMGL